MSAYFITGAGTEIGKTYVACALLRAWRARGLACAALKPIVSGIDEGDIANSDPGLLLSALGQDPSLENIKRIAPWRFSAPLAPPIAARAEGKSVPFDTVVEFCSAATRASTDVLLIEGAGGLMAPLSFEKTNLDLIAALQIRTIFVAGTYLGAVSHALTALDCLTRTVATPAMVVVSESQDSVGIEDAAAMIGLQRPGLNCALARRDAEAHWADLAARILKS